MSYSNLRHLFPSLLVLSVALLLIAPAIDAGTLRSGAKDPRDFSDLRNISAASCTVTLTCVGGSQVQCSSSQNQCSTSGDGRCVVCDGQTQGCCEQTVGECVDACEDAADECRAGCGGFGACLFFCDQREQFCIDQCFE